MLEKTGVATIEDIESVFPSLDRLEKGPVAIIECFREIPCNPCSTACRRNAIQEFQDINDRPIIIEENCNGCALCVTACPGLAIMVVDYSYSEDEATMKLPYEFLPLPEENEMVQGLDREGKFVDMVRVVKVQNLKTFDRTPLITIALNKEYIKDIRNIRREA